MKSKATGENVSDKSKKSRPLSAAFSLSHTLSIFYGGQSPPMIIGEINHG
jgi:hypothetical protein